MWHWHWPLCLILTRKWEDLASATFQLKFMLLACCIGWTCVLGVTTMRILLNSEKNCLIIMLCVVGLHVACLPSSTLHWHVDQ